jgi:hypothetical protein
LSFTCEEGLLQKTTLLHIENFFQKFALQWSMYDLPMEMY